MARKRVYPDASVFVEALLGPGETHFEPAQAAVLAAEQGITHGMMSGLVMAETIGAPRVRAPQGPPSPDLVSRVQKAIAYFRASTFEYIEESRRAGERAMELAVEFQLKGADALHLALAEGAGCEEFYSLDDKHLAIGDQIDGMRVMRPYGDPQSAFQI